MYRYKNRENREEHKMDGSEIKILKFSTHMKHPKGIATTGVACKHTRLTG